MAVDKLSLSLDDIISRSKRSGGGSRRGFAARAAAGSEDVPIIEEVPMEGEAPMRERSQSPAGGRRAPDGRRVFVGNLNYDTTWMTLKDHFKAAGNVQFADIKREGRGPDARSKGCGVVEFATQDEASRAIAELAETQLDGRSIMVRADRGANPPPDGARGDGGYPQTRRTRYSDATEAGGEWYGGQREGGGGGFRRDDAPRESRSSYGRRDGGGRGGGGSRSGLQIVVFGLPYSFQWQDLKDMVNDRAGGAVRANIMEDRETRRSRGCGTVLFDSEDAAMAAIEALQGTELDGRVITAKMDAFA